MSTTLEWLWLSHVLGPGAAGCGDIMAAFGEPDALLAAVGKEDLSPFLSPAQLARCEESPEAFMPLLQTCEQQNIQVLTMEDVAYPQRLLSIDDAPPVLFATGNPEVLNQASTVGMIGSRRPSEYGVQAAAVIGGRLAKEGVCIVSGLADGLDGECHRAAVDNGGLTVGVLGTAIDKTYPAGNVRLRRQIEQEGAVLSEFAPGERTARPSFLLRNRLIAALSDALCVVEARQKSGTMNTVHHAQRYKKAIFAVPGTIFSSLCAGTNELLETGTAMAAAGAGPILRCLGLDAENAQTPKHDTVSKAQLSPAAKAVWQVLSTKAQNLEQLANAANIGTAEILAALLELEISGLVQSQAGGLYRRK